MVAYCTLNIHHVKSRSGKSSRQQVSTPPYSVFDSFPSTSNVIIAVEYFMMLHLMVFVAEISQKINTNEY